MTTTRRKLRSPMSDPSVARARRQAARRRPLGHGVSGPVRVGVVFIVCAIAFLATTSRRQSDSTLLPGPTQELLGVWGADDPRYRDRGFEIRLDAFNLQVGPDDIRGYPIREVRGERVGEVMWYEITYLTSEGENVHRMSVDDQGQGRLERPADVVWTRREP